MRSVCLFAILFSVSVGTMTVVAQEKAAPSAPAKPTKAKLTWDERKAIAPERAKEWLALIDEGKYAASWNVSAYWLRENYPRQHWIRALEVSMKPLGAVQSRTLGATEFYTDIPGGPPRKYMILRFDTVFENRAVAQESLTLMWHGNEGRWRVAGYFVK